MRGKTSRRSWGTATRRAVVAGAVAALVASCSTTQVVKVRESSAGTCAFLGPNICALLTPGGPDKANLRYVNPNARWTQYNKVLVDPVTFWTGDNSSLSPSDQQALTNSFYQSLLTQLGTKFQVVNEPGPGVMRLQTAITDAQAATPVLRTVSMVVPQARALNTLKYLATGTYSFVGSAQVEAKLTDSVTGQLLGAVVAKRVGGGSVETAAQWQWGDAENAMDAFSKKLTDTLSSWTSGTATAP